MVGLYIRGDKLDPKHITTELGVNPTDSQFKGQKHITKTNKQVVAQIGMWSLISHITTDNLSDHIADISHHIKQKGSTILNLKAVEEAYIDIAVFEESKSCVFFEIDKESMSLLADMALPVHFTVYSG